MPPSIPGHILIRLDEKSVPLKMLQVRRWTGFGLAGAQKMETIRRASNDFCIFRINELEDWCGSLL